MDVAGSIQTSIFAYVLMAVVAMLAAVMVFGIVILLQRAGQKRQPATPVSISVAPAVGPTGFRHAGRASASSYW